MIWMKWSRMSYLNKVFQIESLDKHGSAYFLRGRARVQDTSSEFLFPIDGATFSQLQKITSLDAESRYRLSVNFHWDPFRECNIGKVTRIKEDFAQAFYFTISETFLVLLTDLQRISSIHHLRSLEKRLSKEGFKLLDKVSKGKDKILGKPWHQKAISISVQALISLMLLVSISSSQELYLSGDITGMRTGVAAQEESYQSKEATTSSDTTILIAEVISEKPTLTEFLEVETQVNRKVPNGYVALTFDDGPGVYTRQIIDILREHEVGATFFFIGSNVPMYADAVVYAVENNMSVQNHSWSHPHMVHLSDIQQEEEIQNTNEVLESLTHKRATLFRPPYGSWNHELAGLVKDADMKIMLWNRDPEDWKVRNSQRIISYFKRTQSSGGVYLLHENQQTVNALPAIIRYLKEENLRFAILH